MVTGSYRLEDSIEVWDLRMFKRSRLIPWEGSGSQQALLYDDDSGAGLSVAKKVLKQSKEDSAPYLYTCSLNKKQDLLFAGGAGKNELRVFDFESGNIVGMVSNLPKAIMCGDNANRSNIFAFGAADSKVRIFNIQQVTSSQQE